MNIKIGGGRFSTPNIPSSRNRFVNWTGPTNIPTNANTNNSSFPKVFAKNVFQNVVSNINKKNKTITFQGRADLPTHGTAGTNWAGPGNRRMLEKLKTELLKYGNPKTANPRNLYQLSHIKNLNLENSEIGYQEIKKLASIMENYYLNLDSISFANNIIGNYDFYFFWDFFIKDNHRVKHVNFSNNKINEWGIIGLLFRLKAAPHKFQALTSITLNLNHINDFGAKKIAESIRWRQMANIKNIYLAGNRITQAGKDLIRHAISATGSTLHVSF